MTTQPQTITPTPAAIDPSPRPARRVPAPLRYLAGLSAGRLVLWCYFIYWLVITVRYFDPRPQLWLTAVGLSLIIGIALYINTTRSGKTRVRLGGWPTFRLFLTPFCVSSFAALVKDHGFVLIFSPRWWETVAAAVLCGCLWAATVAARRWTTGRVPAVGVTGAESGT